MDYRPRPFGCPENTEPDLLHFASLTRRTIGAGLIVSMLLAAYGVHLAIGGAGFMSYAGSALSLGIAFVIGRDLATRIAAAKRDLQAWRADTARAVKAAKELDLNRKSVVATYRTSLTVTDIAQSLSYDDILVRGDEVANAVMLWASRSEPVRKTVGQAPPRPRPSGLHRAI